MVVIGAARAAIPPRSVAPILGLDTVLIERYASLGGVCLNVGCIPSKALLHAADVIEQASHASDYGVDFGKPKLNIDKLRGYREQRGGPAHQRQPGMAKAARCGWCRVWRSLFRAMSWKSPLPVAQPNCCVSNNASSLPAAEPVKLPAFPWEDPRIMDSTDALNLAEVPKKLLVVGGGIIGLEMATVYRALGAEVTVVEFMPQLMPGADLDLVKPLADRQKKQVLPSISRPKWWMPRRRKTASAAISKASPFPTASCMTGCWCRWGAVPMVASWLPTRRVCRWASAG